LRAAIPLPTAAFYSPRNRYRADSIINYLNGFGSADTVIIGLTGKDISITKGTTPDWGVMGLGFQPGNACVVSTFRLSKAQLSDQLYKLSLHELGHTQGLPHCKNKTCLMRDAEGGNHLGEETGFCQSCRSFLKSKGWLLK
jgi:archaemetzincin